MLLEVLDDVASSGSEVISQDDFLSKLIPSWPSFVAQLLALLVMVVVVFFVAYKPVKKILVTRQNYVESNIRDAEQAKLHVEELTNEAELNVISAKKEASEIILESKEMANKEKEKILEEARNEANKKIEQAEKEIENMRLEAKEEIREEMINLALDASKEILKRNVSTKDNEEIAKDFISRKS